MGGAVDAVSDVIGGVGGAIGGVTNQIPVIGPYVGPLVTGALLGPAAGVKSLAFNAATGQYKGGGGGSSGGSSAPQYAQPSYNYGANSYQMGNNPLDTSKYFITGDKGVYNLLPALGQITPKTLQPSSLMYGSSNATNQFNKSYFTPYEAYQELSGQMQNDPKALAAFQAMYQPTTPTSKGISPYVDFGLGSSIGNNATYGDIASYASTNQNPFYVPYKGTAGGGGKISTFTAPPSYYEARQQSQQQKLQAMTPEQQAVRQQALVSGNYAPLISSNYSPLFNSLLSNTGTNKNSLPSSNQTTSKSNASKK
jgi:hypothetical protein